MHKNVTLHTNFSHFGDDTCMTRLQSKTKEAGVNTEQPC